jgi:hypothetical protein
MARLKAIAMKLRVAGSGKANQMIRVDGGYNVAVSFQMLYMTDVFLQTGYKLKHIGLLSADCRRNFTSFFWAAV